MFGVDLKVQFHHVPQRFHTPAQDLLAVGLGAYALAVVAGEKEPEHCILVVEIADTVCDNRSYERFMGERASRPVVLLLFALGFFQLRRARVAGRLAHEFAAGGNTAEVSKRSETFYEDEIHLPPSLPMLVGRQL